MLNAIGAVWLMGTVSHLEPMKKIIPLLASTFLFGSRVLFAAELPTPTETITPADVERGSIKVHRLGAERFAVFFTYTEEGAKKMLSFSEKHAGQKMNRRVGDYLAPDGICYAPQDRIEYEKWKSGWLKRRTSKFIVSSEANAQAVVAGLGGKSNK